MRAAIAEFFGSTVVYFLIRAAVQAWPTWLGRSQTVSGV